jgi:tRNA pseudouridine55 synthase
MVQFGILNIDKPPGCTSRAAVDRVERLARPAKVGHAGTLDPLASGVLVICVGKATRLIQHVQRMRKSYRAKFLLGRQSETDDVEGSVAIVEGAPVPQRELLDAVLSRFVGEIQQRPPAYSAIKTDGRRAYHLARQGRPPALPARTVTIHDLHIERFEYPELELSIECGSGTYVRALGRDIAAALGTSAVMGALRRTAVGEFHVEDALALGELSHDALRGRLQSPLAAVADLPRVPVSGSEIVEIRRGRPIKLHPPMFPGASLKPEAVSTAERESPDEWAAVDAEGRLVAILRQNHPGELGPVINFDSDAGAGTV